MQTGSYLQLLSLAARGCSLPTMLLHLPNSVLLGAPGSYFPCDFVSVNHKNNYIHILKQSASLHLSDRIADSAGNSDILRRGLPQGATHQGADQGPVSGDSGRAEMTLPFGARRDLLSPCSSGRWGWAVGVRRGRFAHRLEASSHLEFMAAKARAAKDLITAKSNTMEHILLSLIDT